MYIKSLKITYKSAYGRQKGKIISRYRGGGFKRSYSNVYRTYVSKFFSTYKFQVLTLFNQPFPVVIDSQLNSYYLHGIFQNKSISPLATINTSFFELANLNNRIPLYRLPIGVSCSLIEKLPGEGAKLVRHSCIKSYCLYFTKQYARLRLPSTQTILLSKLCFATVGTIQKSNLKFPGKLKAGDNRKFFNRRPKVRGSAMNAYDHPYGGGEGKTSKGKAFRYSLWGRIK